MLHILLRAQSEYLSPYNRHHAIDLRDEVWWNRKINSHFSQQDSTAGIKSIKECITTPKRKWSTKNEAEREDCTAIKSNFTATVSSLSTNQRIIRTLVTTISIYKGVRKESSSSGCLSATKYFLHEHIYKWVCRSAW